MRCQEVGTTLRILIGYDGSESADAALEDLRRAGLPHDVEAVIVSVGEIMMPPSSADEVAAPDFAKTNCGPRRGGGSGSTKTERGGRVRGESG